MLYKLHVISKFEYTNQIQLEKIQNLYDEIEILLLRCDFDQDGRAELDVRKERYIVSGLE